ncbi:MAG: hypothetical protein AAF587_39370 [Bacteroidota bacterium]
MSDELQDRIEQYLSGEMAPHHKVEFEQELITNKQLAENVRLYMLAHAEIQFAGRELLKSYAQKAYQATKGQEKKTIFLRPMVWGSIAAAIALLILFVILFPQSSRELDTDELFAEYYVPHSAIEARNLDESEHVLREGLDNYYEKNYDKAIAALSQAADSLDGADLLLANFFLGQSYIETGKTEAALLSFAKVSEGSLYGYVSRWNIALAYVRLNKMKEAREQLKTIRSNPNYQFYHRKADELLEILPTE